MSVSNFAKNTLQSAIGSGATSIDIDTATSPYNNMPSSGSGFLKDSLDSPTKWEEISWTGRSAITGGYTLTGVTRNIDSNTGAAQAFDAGHFVTQDPSGTQRTGSDNKVVTGTAGTNGNLAQWNVDGDAVDAGLATSNVVDLGSAQTITGAKSVSATWTFTSGVPVRFESGAPSIRIKETGATTDSGVWDIVANSDALSFRTLNDAETAVSTFLQVSRSANNPTLITFSGVGLVAGSPTGGNQGDGTINAEAVYDDGTLLTDYVLDAELDGTIDLAKWDAAVPNREIPQDKGKPKIEERQHTPAREFDPTELDPEAFWNKVATTRRLPAMDRLQKRAGEGNKTGLGETIQALVETCEAQAVHIRKLEERIKALES